MINAYTKTQNVTSSSAQLNRSIFVTICLDLLDYQNTSNTKTKRIKSLEDAATILEHIVADMNVELPIAEQLILQCAFIKILTKVVEAKSNPNTLYKFGDEIGFIRLLLA